LERSDHPSFKLISYHKNYLKNRDLFNRPDPLIFTPHPNPSPEVRGA
jgi:hypothetical protein